MALVTGVSVCASAMEGLWTYLSVQSMIEQTLGNSLKALG